MKAIDLFLLCLMCYGLGVFTAIFVVLFARLPGRQKADRYWSFEWDKPTHTDDAERLRIPTGMKL